MKTGTKIALGVLGLIIVGGTIYYFVKRKKDKEAIVEPAPNVREAVMDGVSEQVVQRMAASRTASRRERLNTSPNPNA